MIPKVSLEQWAVFKAVIDEGSFAKAAEALNKSQSTVSYSIAKLEQSLPTPLLVQRGRKAELTEAGETLYRHASRLLEQASQLDNTAAYLASGWESEVTLAVDAIAPMDKVFCGLQRFSLVSPQTRVRILETTLSGTEEAILLRDADIAIGGRVPPAFMGESLGVIDMIAVASPSHPLFEISGLITEEDLGRYRQIVVRDTGTKREQDAGWLAAEQRWTVSHFSSSIEAVIAGLGFAFIPEHKIRTHLSEGKLQLLPLATGGRRSVTLFLIVAAQSHAGPAAKAVASALLEGLGGALK